MNNATASSIQNLTLAYFGRPADPASLIGWPASKLTLNQIVQIYVNTAEYRLITFDPNSVLNATGGRTVNDTTLINTFYVRLFGRSAAAVEVAGWTNALATGAVNYDFLGITILNAGLNLSTTGAAGAMRAVLQAKIDSSSAYTTAIATTPGAAVAYSTAIAIQDGITYNLSTTTSTAKTTAQATAAVVTMKDGSNANAGQTFTLTTNIETVPATGVMAANSSVTGVINGATGTFQTGDIINGNATSNAAITIAAQSFEFNGPLVQINTIGNLTFRTLAAAPINATTFNNVGTITSSQSTNVLTVNNGAIATNYALTNTLSGNIDGLAIGLRAGDVGGTSNAINFSVAGAGTASSGSVGAVNSVLSTTITGIEGISVATTGRNFFTINGFNGAITDSATLTLTGTGTNDVTIAAGGMAATSNIVASALGTALNLNVGTNLSTNDSLTGGSGTDVLRATVNGLIAANLNISAFETLRVDSGAAAGTLTFAAAPAFTNLRVDAGAGQALRSFLNIGTLTNVNFVGTGTAAGVAIADAFSPVTITGGFAGSTDTLAVNFSNGGQTRTAGGNYTVATAALTSTGVETYTVNVADTTTNAITTTLNGITDNGGLTSVRAVSNGNIVLGAITATGASGFGSITSIDFTGVTGTNAVSSVNTVNNSLAAASLVTAGASGLSYTLNGAEQVADVINFIGGTGADTFTAALYLGNVVASGGDGVDTFALGTAGGARELATAALSGGAGADVFQINDVAAATISDFGNGVDTLTVGATSNVTAAVVANYTALADANLSNAGVAILNMAAAVTTVNLAANTTVANGFSINAFATTASTITGSASADTITGSIRNDVITGGAGADRLTGGAGADLFVQLATATTAATAAGTAGAGAANEFRNGETIIMGAAVLGFDVITDFVAGTDTARLGTGVVGATLLTGANGAGSQITAAGNFGIRGNLTAATTFTADAAGLSTLLFTSTAALDANEHLSLGTNFTVLNNVVLTAGQLTAAIVA